MNIHSSAALNVVSLTRSLLFITCEQLDTRGYCHMLAEGVSDAHCLTKPTVNIKHLKLCPELVQWRAQAH